MSIVYRSNVERLFYEHYILEFRGKASVIGMAFKDRIKKLRGDRRMTQEELAKALDVPSSTIRRYESADEGYPKKERLDAIADFFNCSVDYLMERTDDASQTLSGDAIESIDPFTIFELLDQYTDDEILQKFRHVGEGGVELDDSRAREFISFARYLKNKGN